jgi:predicted HicB family RNase H-like nuclease
LEIIVEDTENVALFVRINSVLKARLEARAKAERRSLASLVEILLRQSLADRDVDAA